MGGGAEKKKEAGGITDSPAGRDWFFSVSLVGGIMFVLGVLVGRGISPVTFDIPDMEARIRRLLMKERAFVSPETPELAFFEALKQEEDFSPPDLPVKTQRFPGEKTPLAQPPTSRKEETLQQRISLPETEERIAAVPPPVVPSQAVIRERTVPREVPVATPPKPSVSSSASSSGSPAATVSSSEGLYTIQVAAVKKPEDAALLVKRFRDSGYAAYAVTGTDAEGGVWYRVRVGRFGKRDAAEPVLEKLAAERVRGFVLRAE